MAKAMVTECYALDIEDNLYKITGTAAVTTGSSGHIFLTFEASSPTFIPVLPNWRTRVRDAVIDAAAAENIEVDQVLHIDLSIL